jgi:hypothetical protein
MAPDRAEQTTAYVETLIIWKLDSCFEPLAGLRIALGYYYAARKNPLLAQRLVWGEKGVQNNKAELVQCLIPVCRELVFELVSLAQTPSRNFICG